MKYRITIEETYIVEVEAKSEREAIQKAMMNKKGATINYKVEKIGLDPCRFLMEESVVDTVFADWHNDIISHGDEKLFEAYNKLDKVFDDFRKALTKAGFKGYWNDEENENV